MLQRKTSTGKQQSSLPSTTPVTSGIIDTDAAKKKPRSYRHLQKKIVVVMGVLLLVHLWRVQLGEPQPKTIYIPIESKPEGVIPSVGFKFREGSEGPDDRQLRNTGMKALNQYGDQLRNLMLLGGEFLQPGEATSDPGREASFRELLFSMAPWLKGDPTRPGWPLNQFSYKQNSKAVLVCAGDNMLPYLDTILHTMFNIHKTKLPVYISYRGDADLSQSSRDKIKARFSSSAGTLNFLDLTEKFNLDAAQLNIWNLRPFGALAVPEAEVAILDADVVLYRPPEDLFQIDGYKDKGALFFHDRIACEICGLWTPRTALLGLQPHPSPLAQDTIKVQSEHIQEAGVILIDKSRRSRGLWGNLLILGRWDVRRFIQRDMVYGDKETYWIGFETVNEPYAFARYWSGVVGNVFTDYDKRSAKVDSANVPITDEYSGMALCGRLLHVDDKGVPLWSNGGYLTREDDRETEDNISAGGLRPLFFVDGGDSWNEYENVEGGVVADDHMFELYQSKKYRNQFWKFAEKLGVNCLLPNSRGARPLNTEDAKSGLDAVDYYFNKAMKKQ